jgi:hypothetical protein
MLNARLSALLIILLALSLLSFTGCYQDRICEFVAPSTASASPIPEGFGVNISFTDPRPGEMKMLADAGFRWVRMDLKWDATEKEKGEYDFSAYDRLVAAQRPYGVRTLFILDYGNPLYDNDAPPRTEASRQAFARWAVAAANHFKGRGALWELYNEPNHSLFWPPDPNVQEYIALAQEVGRAWRKSVPDEKLIGPATSEIDFEFLESCFKAGLLEYWSAVSIHPYRHSNPESAASDYCRLRELIQAYAPTKEVPVIASEWGYSSAWPGFNEAEQGQMLARAWLTNVANGITLSIWYDWHDDGLDAGEAEHHFGTVANAYYENREPVYDPKPAYLAAKTLTTFLSGYRFERRLPLLADNDYLLVFRKGDDLRLAVWTTGPVHSTLLPVPARQYTLLGFAGGDQRTVSTDQKGLLITLTAAPLYIR